MGWETMLEEQTGSFNGLNCVPLRNSHVEVKHPPLPYQGISECDCIGKWVFLKGN